MAEPDEQIEDMKAAPALPDRAAARLSGLLAEPLAPGLYVVATPIGNLADITLRALAVLASADCVYCEDTRHSRGLFSAFGISQRLRSYHEHNAEEERPRILAELARGRRIALICDAGTPLVSDPGYKLVREAAAEGIDIIAVPGASAVLAALTAAGLPSDRFLFAGFLPAKVNARRDAIAGLAQVQATLVLFEAPGRLPDCLADLAAALGPREAVIARELTKLHEELLRGTLAQLATAAENTTFKGEIVILVSPPAPVDAEVTDDAIARRLEVLLRDMRLKDAARLVADEMDVPRKRVYDIGLACRRDAP